LRERLQESFLRGLFGLTAIAKETMRDMKNSRAKASYNLSEGRLVVRACAPRQFEFGRLFVTVRQKRSFWNAPAERSGDGALDTSERSSLTKSTGSANPFPNPKRRRRFALPAHSKLLLVVARSALSTALAASGFELRFHLFKLGLLLSGQDSLHFLMKLKSLAHQFGLQARRFR